MHYPLNKYDEGKNFIRYTGKVLTVETHRGSSVSGTTTNTISAGKVLNIQSRGFKSTTVKVMLPTGRHKEFDAQGIEMQEGDEVEFVITDSDFNTRIGGKTVDDDIDAENVRHQETLVGYGEELLEARGADNVANVKEVLKSLYEKGKVKFSKLYEGLGRLGLMVEEYQNYVNQVNSLEALKGKKVLTTAERHTFMPSNFSKRFAIVKENGKSPKTNKKTTASKAKIGNFVDRKSVV